MKTILQTTLILIIAIAFIRCGNTSKNSIKLYPNDPFKNTMTESEIFEIDAKLNNVVSGKEGTVIVCPKGCFTNSKGEIFKGNVKIELSEALALSDMLLSNLTTTSKGQPLETDGMIYFNATSNGEQLRINKDIPVHIQIPTEERKPGMMVYKGIRDENGNMDWTEPKELDKFLTTVVINSLDFLPEGFQTTVDQGMPYKGYKTAPPALTDSLYYSLDYIRKPMAVSVPPIAAQYNEAYYNKNKKVENGKYTDESYEVNQSKIQAYVPQDSQKMDCGIEPLYIKVLKSAKYQNTLIATKEFEARLKAIFKTCDTRVLAFYVNNLDKNLYEIDEMAASHLKGTAHFDKFQAFTEQKLTKVREADIYAQLLKGNFEKQLEKSRSDLEKAKQEVYRTLDKKNEEAKKVTNDYKKLLFKREKFRMETYGFKWTETGWINIDNGTLAKDWLKQPLQIAVDNGQQFDRVYTYVFYKSIKSLYRLNSDDKQHFYAGNEDDKKMLMPKLKPAIAIAIGYRNDIPSMGVKEFLSGSDPNFSISLSPSSLVKVKATIGEYEKYAKENKISIDLEFMAKFHVEEQRQKALMMENEFMLRLWNKAYPCCGDTANGEMLFMANCTSCHALNVKLIGPALSGVTERHTSEWLYQWTKNNEQLRRSGDKEAIRVYNENGKVAMNVFDGLSREQIEAIYTYIALNSKPTQ